MSTAAEKQLDMCQKLLMISVKIHTMIFIVALYSTYTHKFSKCASNASTQTSLKVVNLSNDIIQAAANELIENIADQVMLEDDNSGSELEVSNCDHDGSYISNSLSRSWHDIFNEEGYLNEADVPPGFCPKDSRAALEIDAVA
ncbi:hypothetical protein ACLB2K_050169 [Fragaria x ananassa]